ncbi:MAG: hypothetical protein JRI25_04140 [Deltaproteobacteria bacterium]|nr:hypothetical protein [Deltaproteobacteria bacterium]MBW2253769.1 hypothetical protein [Deltaproteobacteria bacterium]
MTEVLDLGVTLGAGLPALLHPARARTWWWTTDGPAWHDGERLWVQRSDRVLVIPMPGGEVEVEPLPDGGLVAWSLGGELLFVGRSGAPTWAEGPPDDDQAVVQVRNGADSRAVRIAGRGWRVQCDRTDVPLPEGATRARDLRPFRRGEGVCWRSEGWLYRMAHRQAPRAIAEIGKGQTFRVGPLGAVVIGDDEAWEQGAAPTRSARPLPTRLARTEWGLRWSADGRVVAGVDPEGAAIWVDLVRGQVVRTVPAALPLNGSSGTLGWDGILEVEGFDSRGWRPAESSWARRGKVLGGPGGVAWDLSVGHPLFTRAAFELGATVATSAGWATVDWESGLGHWVDPGTGVRRDEFQVGLRTGDLISRGWADGTGAVLETAEGRQYAVKRGWVAAIPDHVEPPHDTMEHGLILEAGGLRVGRRGRLWPLPVEAAARVGDRVYAWSADGLLVVLPV